MKTAISAFCFAALLVGCGKLQSSPSVQGFWKLVASVKPGEKQTRYGGFLVLIEFTDREVRYLHLENRGAEAPAIADWRNSRSYKLDGNTLIDWETARPSNRVTYEVSMPDPNHLQMQMKSRESRIIPGDSILYFERLSQSEVDKLIAGFTKK